jgi:hypothetical protein
MQFFQQKEVIFYMFSKKKFFLHVQQKEVGRRAKDFKRQARSRKGE